MSSSDPFIILIIDSEQIHWDQIFSEQPDFISKYNIQIEQTTWENILSVTSFNENFTSKSKRCEVTMRPYKTKCSHNEQRNKQRVCRPQFVLVRKLVQGLKIDQHDYTNHLLGMIHCNLDSVNNLKSIYLNLQRPIIHGILTQIRDDKGYDKFPLIDQYYYSEPHTILFTPNSSENKVVLKVGSAEAGYGKVLLNNDSGTLRDFAGVVTRYNDFMTCEPFISNRRCDIRVQKIGKNIRVYERVSSNWKGNVGNSILKEVEVKKHYKGKYNSSFIYDDSIGKDWIKWVDEAMKREIGCELDIFTLDAILVETIETGKTTPVITKEYILEINDSASGLAPENLEKDLRLIRDLVIEKIKK